MNPHVERKRRWQELEELAWAHFKHLLGENQIPAEEAERITSGVIINPGKPRNSVTLKVSLLPPAKPEEEMCVNGIPIDNHWDTKPLCIVEVDAATEEVTVTIHNEMPWLRHDMLK
ncbi:hypothetical protein [Undibacterium sp.]|uniref:hypothetical protein n=1 Tax=Undibacterium sp. TaxID=1914977 RepID=UPI00272F576B|nr:hypothetical protein [Undibacterium sp.]MDP1978959.1 hypothetical protein [Undibacterium sp.]